MNRTIKYFLEITKIYRESKHEDKMVKYLEDFAKERNLSFHKDKFKNVLITKKVNDKPPIILQAHQDMICISNNNFDFKNKPIPVKMNKRYIYTNGTTLGADDGIGIALILTVFDKVDANIEGLFTVSEEVDMSGAKNFDTSKITGKYLINLDGFDKFTIINKTASFFDLEINKKISRKNSIYNNTYKIEISGLKGGHSGADIDKSRGNAIIILASILKDLNEELISFKGGTKNNVIPSNAIAYFNSFKKPDLEKLNKYKDKYKDLNINIRKCKYQNKVMRNTKEYLDSILKLPKNIYYKNKFIVTSYNLGVIDNNIFKIGLRSSDNISKDKVLKKIINNGKIYNYKVKQTDFEPGFKTNKNSKLIKILKENNKKSLIKEDHITVEVGFLQAKKKELEIAIIAPEIKYAHSTKERVNTKSIIDTEKWLEKVINKLQ
ncbi:MAG TPA: M20/M25/M40 family metallo-hydrolase [Candidatus Onthocola stercorigallinarum]|nr:M20/M25/M40 family metallo-hydrolase [Candidatus Onthocola stercorigallinarum]